MKGRVICRCPRPLQLHVETLPALQHDPNRPEDVLKVNADEDSVGGDDAPVVGTGFAAAKFQF